VTGLTRRSALSALFALAPVAALASTRHHQNAWPGYNGGISVDVSPLRRDGDNTDADFLADVLPGYLRQSFGGSVNIQVRIDDVVYGTPGADGTGHSDSTIDYIEGVGRMNGREVPLLCSVPTQIFIPDSTGYGAHLRQDTLARSFAQWLPRQMGL
jgi:hypothetical protein